MEGGSLRATGSHVKQMPHTGSVQKKAVSWRPIPANLSRWFVGLVHWGDRDHPLGVLAGLLTRWHLIPVLIFFFIVDSLDLLTQGNWTVARAHVPAFAAHRRMVGGSGEEPQQRWRYPSDHRSSAGHNWCILWGQWRQSFELFLPIDFFLADPAWPCRTSGELTLACSKLARWLGLIRLRQTWSDLTQGWP